MKARKYLLMVTSVALSVGVAACGSGLANSYSGSVTEQLSSSAQTQGNVGSYQSTSSSMTLSLTQSGGAVSGTLSLANGPSMSVIGQVSGSSVSIQATNTNSNSSTQYGYSQYGGTACASMVQMLSGTLTTSGNVLSGTLTGTVSQYGGSGQTCTVTINAIAAS